MKSPANIILLNVNLYISTRKKRHRYFFQLIRAKYEWKEDNQGPNTVNYFRGGGLNLAATGKLQHDQILGPITPYSFSTHTINGIQLDAIRTLGYYYTFFTRVYIKRKGF